MNVFGLGGPELLVLVLLGVVILGPRRVVTVAREAGKLISQMQSLATEVRRQVTQELAILEADELAARKPRSARARAAEAGEEHLPEAYQRFAEDFPEEAPPAAPPPMKAAPAAGAPANGTPANGAAARESQPPGPPTAEDL